LDYANNFHFVDSFGAISVHSLLFASIYIESEKKKKTIVKLKKSDFAFTPKYLFSK